MALMFTPINSTNDITDNTPSLSSLPAKKRLCVGSTTKPISSRRRRTSPTATACCRRSTSPTTTTACCRRSKLVHAAKATLESSLPSSKAPLSFDMSRTIKLMGELVTATSHGRFFPVAAPTTEDTAVLVQQYLVDAEDGTVYLPAAIPTAKKEEEPISLARLVEFSVPKELGCISVSIFRRTVKETMLVVALGTVLKDATIGLLSSATQKAILSLVGKAARAEQDKLDTGSSSSSSNGRVSVCLPETAIQLLELRRLQSLGFPVIFHTLQ